MDYTDLSNYYNLLESHDWYYFYSDDFRVYSSGNRNLKLLVELSNLSEKHKELYENFNKHMFSGEPFNTEKHPKPTI
jgi:hypothetical protein